MKQNKTTWIVFGLLILACSLYRVWDGRPWGFAPQIAMALFAGSVIKNKKISFLFPILSMLLSDALYQFLYSRGVTDIKGFYDGQWLNYLLFASITVIGFFINKKKVGHIIAGSLAGVAFFFLSSNFGAWIGGAPDINNLPYPKTFAGLMSCYAAGIPFFKGSLWATLLFSGLFFGSYQLYSHFAIKTQVA